MSGGTPICAEEKLKSLTGGFELLPQSRVSAKPQEEKNKKIERKVHNDETKGFRDMGGSSFCFGRNCSNLNL